MRRAWAWAWVVVAWGCTTPQGGDRLEVLREGQRRAWEGTARAADKASAEQASDVRKEARWFVARTNPASCPCPAQELWVEGRWERFALEQAEGLPREPGMFLVLGMVGSGQVKAENENVFGVFVVREVQPALSPTLAEALARLADPLGE